MATSATMPTKDPDEVKDYEIDWSLRLATSETISSSAWTVQSGITKDSDSSTSTTGTIWLSSGSVGTTYKCTNHIVTNQGRTFEESIYVPVVTK